MRPASVALDLGGILLTDPTLGKFWVDAAGGDESAGERAKELWFRELREPFERGELLEDRVWDELGAVTYSSPASIRQRFLGNFLELPKGIAALRACQASGLKVVLATNHYSPWVPLWRERFDWFSLISEVVCSSDVRARKPESAFYSAALSACGPSQSRPYFVDDLVENVDAASMAGFEGLLGDGTGAWAQVVVGRGYAQ